MVMHLSCQAPSPPLGAIVEHLVGGSLEAIHFLGAGAGLREGDTITCMVKVATFAAQWNNVIRKFVT